jgi:hypothetical protein
MLNSNEKFGGDIMNTKIRVSGNIISELSEKIPSNIIALNELVKNSYDAGAKKVTIKLDSKNKKLTIIDDGCGMDEKEINTLFHISISTKKYGELNEHNRYTQGSKGLGFLAVFKFGEHVVWETKKIRGFEFSVDYSDLISKDDISQYQVNIFEKDIEKQGTKIEIDLSEYNANSLIKYFSQAKNYQKIIHAFDDNKFIIELQIDDKLYSSTNADYLILKNCLPENQMYYVTYKSIEQQIKFYYNDNLIHCENFKFSSNLYSLNIELMIFKFKPYGKYGINRLFYNPQDELTPLIYINSNLFVNYELFDPNINAKNKIGKMLNQMIGYIRIISSNPMISFNSDRTQFLQNELTDEIKDFLFKINLQIQEIGYKFKKYLPDLHYLKYDELPQAYQNSDEEQLKNAIKDDFPFKDEVTIKKNRNKVTYSVFGKSIDVNILGAEKGKRDPKQKGHTENKKNPAFIKIVQPVERIPIPSEQIDLGTKIKEAKDSNGNDINIDNIDIKVDGAIYKDKILSSIVVPCSKIVQFSYNDSSTGMVIEQLTLVFYQPETKVDVSELKEYLITLPTNKSYTVNFNPTVGKLVDQINSLELKGYEEVIACSLRAIFEISVDSIIKSPKFDNIFYNISKLEKRVVQVITYITSEKHFISEISNKTSIDYSSLVNMLNPGEYEEAIYKAHLGAHKSDTYLSEYDIIRLARMAGIFIIVVNEMINNPSII